jgi:hypothetical protein
LEVWILNGTMTSVLQVYCGRIVGTPQSYDTHTTKPISSHHYHTLPDGEPCLKSLLKTSHYEQLWTKDLSSLEEQIRKIKSRILSWHRRYEKAAHDEAGSWATANGRRYVNSSGWAATYTRRFLVAPLIIPQQVSLSQRA